ncbi:DUF523 domain-containing protein [Pseudodesulfovibrio sediminis]|uniref:DUF523 domain-containing protein n=1 Tax=Pseudodesulfovibrio sediminis TaxID=2810563 RepID=A0ABM7P8B4_9BACT|nr:DUF523 domain-containing protein [Pseudodesulfovibrio sediminis]BCS89277.1 hypothetical protein PSDVSF_25190 [Pseudodesulfovibrio sediminis]
MKHSPCIVSACLIGMFCRYSGEVVSFGPAVELVRQGRAIPFCPEAMGGLSTPRKPCEIKDGRVVDSDGVDQTAAFRRGAEEGLRLAKLAGCTEAILKTRSPSCGCGIIYDGSFTSTCIQGDGVFAALLKEHGITVRSEEDLVG